MSKFKAVLRKEVPPVLFNRVCSKLDTPQVIVGDYDEAYHAMEHLIEQGYRCKAIRRSLFHCW